MFQSIIKPKRPKSEGWQQALWWKPNPMLKELGYPVIAFEHPHTGLFVLSAVEAMQEKDEKESMPFYHLSISCKGERATTEATKWVLKKFKMEDAKEDNHVPHGKVRNFFRPVADHLSGYECPCTETESAIKEGEYIWRGIK